MHADVFRRLSIETREGNLSLDIFHRVQNTDCQANCGSQKSLLGHTIAGSVCNLRWPGGEIRTTQTTSHRRCSCPRALWRVWSDFSASLTNHPANEGHLPKFLRGFEKHPVTKENDDVGAAFPHTYRSPVITGRHTVGSSWPGAHCSQYLDRIFEEHYSTAIFGNLPPPRLPPRHRILRHNIPFLGHTQTTQASTGPEDDMPQMMLVFF